MEYQITEVSDVPMWSRVDLTTAKPTAFFAEGGGINNKTSITTPNKIDNLKDFDIRRIEVSLQATDKQPLETADLAKIALLQRNYWAQLYTNDTRRSWFAHMGSLLAYPLQVAAAGAAAYNPVDVVKGAMNINVDKGLVIKGGDAFQFLLTSEDTADDLTGLTMIVTLWGRLYKTMTV